MMLHLELVPPFFGVSRVATTAFDLNTFLKALTLAGLVLETDFTTVSDDKTTGTTAFVCRN